MKVIIFKAAETHVAVNLSDVREVLRRESVDHGDTVECIRGNFVKICDAGNFLMGLSSSESTKKTILLEKNGRTIGLSTPDVSRIYDVVDTTVQKKAGGTSSVVPDFCEGIFRLQDFSTPIYLLDMEKVFTSDAAEEQIEIASTEAREEIVATSRAICFKLGNCEYAFSINETVEIIRGRESRVVPDTKTVVEGLINLRGIVLPVIDLRKLAGAIPQGTSAMKDKSKIIIVRFEDQLIGFRVEVMTEVTPYLAAQVEPLPETLITTGHSWIQSMLKINDKRTIFFINSDWFVKHAA